MNSLMHAISLTFYAFFKNLPCCLILILFLATFNFDVSYSLKVNRHTHMILRATVNRIWGRAVIVNFLKEQRK